MSSSGKLARTTESDSAGRGGAGFRPPMFVTVSVASLTLLLAASLISCGGGKQVNATNSPLTGDSVFVAVTKATRKTLEQHLTVSSELGPFQEIDVYAKESGFVKKLDVDFGSHVKTGDVMA